MRVIRLTTSISSQNGYMQLSIVRPEELRYYSRYIVKIDIAWMHMFHSFSFISWCPIRGGRCYSVMLWYKNEELSTREKPLLYILRCMKWFTYSCGVVRRHCVFFTALGRLGCYRWMEYDQLISYKYSTSLSIFICVHRSYFCRWKRHISYSDADWAYITNLICTAGCAKSHVILNAQLAVRVWDPQPET